MKILIYGVGVIGVTYGWQLSLSGNDITMMVKPEKKQQIEKNGFSIHCSDFRYGEKRIASTVFNPKVIDTLHKENDFDYIIVTVGSDHLNEVLPALSKFSGNAHILFFQNIYNKDLKQIEKFLPASKYFFGFPFMVGGGKNGLAINAIISGSKYSKTMLGEVDGIETERVRQMADAMQKSGMVPFVSEQIVNWLIPHAVFIAVLSAGIVKAGGKIENLLRDKNILKESVRTIREGFNICNQTGINPKKEKVNQLYYFPFFICLPIIKKIFSNEDMSLMFNIYVEQSREEIKTILENIIGEALRYNIPTPCLTDLYNTIS